jgi:histidyl-tRNA synthetase
VKELKEEDLENFGNVILIRFGVQISTSSMIFYDAETLLVIADVFDEIKAKLNLWSITVHYNDRKFLANLLDHYPNKSDLYNLFDKYYKIGQETFDKELVQLVGDKEAMTIKNQIIHPNKKSRTNRIRMIYQQTQHQKSKNCIWSIYYQMTRLLYRYGIWNIFWWRYGIRKY